MEKVFKAGIGVSLIALGTLGTINIEDIKEAKAETVNVKSSDGSIVKVNKLRVFIVKDKVEGSNIEVGDTLKGISHFFSTQQVKAEDLGMKPVPSKLPIAPNKVNYGSDNVYEYYQVTMKDNMSFNYNITSGLTSEDLKGLDLKGVYKYNLEGNTLVNGSKVSNNTYLIDDKLDTGQHALVLFVKTNKESLSDSVDGLTQGNKLLNGLSLHPFKGASGLEVSLTIPQLKVIEESGSCKNLFTTYGLYNIPKKLNGLYIEKLDTNKDGVMCNLSNQPMVNKVNYISSPDISGNSNWTDNPVSDTDDQLEGTPIDPTNTEPNEPDVIGGVNPDINDIIDDGASDSNPIDSNSSSNGGTDDVEVIDLGKEGDTNNTSVNNNDNYNNDTSLNNIQDKLDSLSNSGYNNSSLNTDSTYNQSNVSNLVNGNTSDTLNTVPNQNNFDVYNLPDTGQSKESLGLLSGLLLGVGFGLMFNRRNKVDA